MQLNWTMDGLAGAVSSANTHTHTPLRRRDRVDCDRIGDMHVGRGLGLQEGLGLPG
jgi:hypothetical protein